MRESVKRAKPRWLRHCAEAILYQAVRAAVGIERQLPKLDVAGSIPVSRSIFPM